MWAIYKKEIRQYFSSLTAFISIIAFLLLTGLFLFVFPDSSILEFGYASLDKFFEISPWILLFLVPAMTMRSFADEFRAGTFEILQTKPISPWQVIGGKYFASLMVIGIALLPTLIYLYTIRELSTQAGIDMGATLGSYLGLFFLAATFAAIGICCSSFTGNPVVAFIASAFSCYLLYSGFNTISKIPSLSNGPDYYLEMLGIDFHYRSISRGVVDSRDLIYFLSVIFFFTTLTKRNLRKR